MSVALSFRAGDAALFTGLPGGFVAGFTLRGEGLDLLPPDELARRLAAGLGAPGAEVRRLKQVHGAAVVDASAGLPPPRPPEGDALVTGRTGQLLAVSTADCVPLILLDPRTGTTAAVHAGWRGTAAGVVDAALDALLTRGAAPPSLHALFGPSISRDAYEVGPEVVAAVAARLDGGFPAGARREGAGGKSFLDVALVNEAVLLRRGVAPGRIFRPALCTAGEPGLFPSYRRDGARAGRILTGVVRLG